jgi:flagellar export protein FliJ
VTGSAFRFRLERVRSVRERKEKLAKQELAKALSRLSSTEADLRTIEAHLEQAHIEQRAVSARSETLSAAELLERQTFLERVEAQRRAQVQEVEQRTGEVADRDAALTVAAGEHEMLNRLRERDRSEHTREAARQEQGALDEIATSRFYRSPA